METVKENLSEIGLQDENYFDFLNGLWTGKKPPFAKAVVIRNTNFRNDGQVDYSNIAVLDVETKQLEKRKLQKGDIIIERSGGGPKQPVGRVVYFNRETEEKKYSFSNFTSVVRVKNKDTIDSKYVFYFLHNFYLEGKTDQLQRRTTGIRNLDFQSYKDAIIFPPITITEQKEIAKNLTIIQEAIGGQKELIAKLKDLKRNMTQHLFAHGTKGEKTKMTEIGEIPESWKIIELGSLCRKIVGGGTPSTKNKNYWQGKIPWITSKWLGKKLYLTDGEKMISDEAVKKSATHIIPENSLIFATRVGVGKIGINTIPITINQDLAGLIVSANTSALFLAYQINIDRIQKHINSLKRGATIQGITREDMKKIMIALPPEKEQKDIANDLLIIDKKIELTQKKLSTYQNLFKTLLHELVSGKRKINY